MSTTLGRSIYSNLRPLPKSACPKKNTTISQEERRMKSVSIETGVPMNRGPCGRECYET